MNYASSFKTTKQNIRLDIFQCYTPLNDKCEETEVMGRQWLGKMNGNGDILADLCAFNSMIRGGRQKRNAGFIRQSVYNRSTKQKIKSTISAYESIQNINAGCESIVRGRCCLSTPSGAGQNVDETKEERSQKRVPEFSEMWTS